MLDVFQTEEQVVQRLERQIAPAVGSDQIDGIVVHLELHGVPLSVIQAVAAGGEEAGILGCFKCVIPVVPFLKARIFRPLVFLIRTQG